jgi:HSP20 family protein
MTLVRWEPVRQTNPLQQELNRLFNGFVASGSTRYLPAMDLVEKDGEYVLKADLPGLGEGDVNVELDGNVLTVSGERRTEGEQTGEGYRRIERSHGRFSRSLTLPEGVEADAIVANFERGVLEVKIPKPEQRKPHRVPVGAGSES